ncbi:SMI1/KNR4 family protein [Sphingobacterium siyangense]|uniref:SMI1/KNR4 family protein n=1 Tax=Sphingobacterium TaxID=28453 RepID=UPI0009589472|nr:MULTISPECIES: SMI1/KNR4 family protein [Sphingobacterium]APU97944.1 SMI1/KNR4 family protein [Sphingobacterium sp. B29]UQA73371.1 SMI1/KNR4 family protein [Sphingobacterium siyangense]
MKTVNELLLKYNFPKSTQKAKTKIEQIQRILNFNLPNDYLFFLQNYSGFELFIGSEFVRLWDIDELIGVNTDYQIFENLPKTLAIGGNGSSEFIAIEQTVDDSIRVVLTPFIDLDKQYHIEIGISFTDFLQRLDNGQEWFK